MWIQKRVIGSKTYLYAVKSVRVGKNIHKVTKCLGNEKKLTKTKVNALLKEFSLEVNDKLLTRVTRHVVEKYPHLKYPLTPEEVIKIEQMNIQYKELKAGLHPKDWEDIIKRFVANFVFESNALEGNSLTLKNFSEIVFEQRVMEPSDIREVHDAQNSYAVFSGILHMKKPLNEKLIIAIHKQLMKNIDTRIGYKKIPNVLLGRPLQLTEPSRVSEEMKKLLSWYEEHANTMYPLELAFRFHHQFETIHPFADGNGRVGRILLNYILLRKGYFPIIIRKNQREHYLKALAAADRRQYIPLIRLGIEKTKETYRKFFETYYQHLSQATEEQAHIHPLKIHFWKR